MVKCAMVFKLKGVQISGNNTSLTRSAPFIFNSIILGNNKLKLKRQNNFFYVFKIR